MDAHRSADHPPLKNTSQRQHPKQKQSVFSKLKQFFKAPEERDENLMELVNAREESDKPPLSPEEKALVASALEFSNQTADSLSVPRADMVILNVEASFNDVMATFAKCQHSRLPVIREDLDDILGFITLKDMVRFVGKKKTFSLVQNLRPCTFVPDNLSIIKVLEAMRHDRVQLAIVVDEYGGTAGLVTLKDVIEVLVGEMEDEHEAATPEMITLIRPNTYQADPRLPIEELENMLQKTFIVLDNNGNEQERDFETVGGLVFSLARRVPSSGESFSTGNGCVFSVLEADGRRLNKLEIRIQPTPEQENDAPVDSAL